MRLAGAILAVAMTVLPAALIAALVAQPRPVRAEAAAKQVPKAAPQKGAPAKTDAKKTGAKKAETKKAEAKKSGPQAGREAYAGIPLAERGLIQFDLAWTGHYNGLINGDFNDRSVAAVRAFQKDHAFKETGVLTAPERALLASRSKEKQAQVGWRMVDDKVTGAQVGLPTAQVPNVSTARSGTRWSSAQGQVQIETFRVRGPGTTLAAVFEQQKKEPPNRKLEVNLIRNDFFILSGLQGLKKFYVRAEVRDLEVRGITILYDQATEGIMDPAVVVMSSAFAPFSGGGLAPLIGPPPRRRVDYGTGIVVTAQGHILTDRQLIDGCNVVEISGLGDADRIADDPASGLALLRVYGAGTPAPAALVHEGAGGNELTLVGIADPQSQGGGRAASNATARLNGDAIEPTPQLGFAGAAALDRQGRVFGMVALKAPVLASSGPIVLPQASVVPMRTIRRFLDAQSVTPATGRPGADVAKQSLVRVICVRR
jgi:peptidoglycan hydrolase-like protein with peptidoglycan-binding domain